MCVYVWVWVTTRRSSVWHRHAPCCWSRAEAPRRWGAVNRQRRRGEKNKTREVRDAGASFKGTPLLCLSSLSTTVPQLRSRLFSAHLTAPHRGNHQDYVSTMLAVRCLLFAAVCARCAVTGESLWLPDGLVLLEEDACSVIRNRKSE